MTNPEEEQIDLFCDDDPTEPKCIYVNLPGFGSECFNLYFWGRRARQERGVKGYGNISTRGAEMSELDWERVDTKVKQVGGHHRHVLIQWYVKCNVDVKDEIDSAIRAFSYVWWDQ